MKAKHNFSKIRINNKLFIYLSEQLKTVQGITEPYKGKYSGLHGTTWAYRGGQGLTVAHRGCVHGRTEDDRVYGSLYKGTQVVYRG